MHPLLILLLSLSHVGHAVTDRQVDDTCQLVRRRRYRLRSTQVCLLTPQKCPQRAFARMQTVGGQSERYGGTIDTWPRSARFHPAPRLLDLWAQTKPTAKMLHRRKFRQIRADLADDH